MKKLFITLLMCAIATNNGYAQTIIDHLFKIHKCDSYSKNSISEDSQSNSMFRPIDRSRYVVDSTECFAVDKNSRDQLGMWSLSNGDKVIAISSCNPTSDPKMKLCCSLLYPEHYNLEVYYYQVKSETYTMIYESIYGKRAKDKGVPEFEDLFDFGAKTKPRTIFQIDSENKTIILIESPSDFNQRMFGYRTYKWENDRFVLSKCRKKDKTKQILNQNRLNLGH